MRTTGFPGAFVFFLLAPLTLFSQSNDDAAYQAFNQKDYQKTIEYATAAIQADPSDWRAYTYRGSARIQLMDYQEAVADFRMALADYHDGDNQIVKTIEEDLGLCYLNAGQYDLSISAFDQSLGIAQDGNAYWNRGLAYQNKKDYQDATNDYARAVPYFTGDNLSLSTLYSNMGNCNNKLAFYNIALQYLNEAISLNPGNGTAYWNRGIVYRNLNKFDQAIGDYTQALEYVSKPADQSILHSNLAYCAYYSGQDSLALAHAFQSMNLDPGNIDAYNAAASAYFQQWQYDSALEYFEKAATMTSDPVLLATLHEKAGSCEYFLGKYQEGKAACESALIVSPDMVEAHYFLARIGMAQRDYPGAVKELKKTVQLETDTSNLQVDHNLLAQCYKALGWYKEGLQEFARAFQAAPYRYFSYLILIDKGNLETSLYRYKDALSDFTQALRLDADSVYSATVFLDCANAYTQMGRLSEAREALDKARNLNADTGLYNYYMGNAAYFDGHFAEALSFYKTGIGHFQNASDLASDYNMMGKASMNMQDYASAERYYDSAVSRGWDKGYYLEEKGRCLLKEGKKQEGIAAFTRSLQWTRENLDSSSSMVYCYALLGKMQSAHQLLGALIQEARAGHGNLPSLLYDLSCLENLEGNHTAALASFKKAIEAGYANYTWIKYDDDLLSLRNTAAFQGMLGSIKHRMNE